MELRVDDRRVYAYTGTKDIVPGQRNVAFIHGSGNDHSVWELQSRYLAHHGRNVLAVDLPGHGRSEGPPLPSIEAMADWTLRLLDAAELPRATLVGHSMGALVALDAAARYPDRIRAIALLAIAVPMAVNDELLAAAQADDHAAIDMITVWGHGREAHIGGNPSPGMWMLGGGMRLLERARPGVLYNDLRACNDYAQGLERAERVRCPALVLLGTRDLMTPARAAGDVVAALSDARVVRLEGCGHMMTTEAPERVLDALCAFEFV